LVLIAGGLALPAAWTSKAASAPAPPSSSPFPALEGPLNVTADEMIVDNTGAGLTARGHVRLTYAAGVATANVLRLRRAERTAQLIGNAVLTDPQGKATGDDITVAFTTGNQIRRITMAGNASAETKDYALQADHITADRAAGRLAADGHVTLFTAPDLIVNGDRAVYTQSDHYGVVSGHVVASNRAGRILGEWVEFFQQKEQAIVHGPVQADVYGATITGKIARIDFAKSSAVFTGNVLVARRQGTLNADRVTILYNARRLIAEGGTRAHFTDLESDTR
jgi:lipopolysaccharide assembly outer membrane protein LptD (OstA)